MMKTTSVDSLGAKNGFILVEHENLSGCHLNNYLWKGFNNMWMLFCSMKVKCKSELMRDISPVYKAIL